MKKNIVITILAVLVVGLGCFIIYDKVIDKNEKKDNDVVEKEEKNVEEDYDLVKAKELIDKFYDDAFYNFFDGKYNEKQKSHFAAKNLGQLGYIDVEELGAECSDSISSQTSGSYYCKLRVGDNYYYSTQLTFEAPYDLINESYKKLYGNDNNISKETIPMGIADYVYIDKTNSFVQLNEYGIGLINPATDIYGVKSAKVTEKNLVITVGYVEMIPSVSDEPTAIIDGNQVTFTQSEIENQTEFLNKYLDKLDTYEFEFLYEDGIYKLKNVVKK